MIRASVHNTTQLFFPQEANSQNPVVNFRLREFECISLLKKCDSLEELRQVHGQILKLGLFWSHPFRASNLVATCALSEWGSMEYASWIFRRIDEPVTFDYNVMARGHVKDLNFEAGLNLFEEMLVGGVVPDNFTYPPTLKACAGLSLLDEGMQIHGQVLKLGYHHDLFVQNSLINMYGKSGKIRDSCAVFQQMGLRSVASWSSLIAAHVHSGI
ncbi:hypothetical protein Nepgr_011012 [Nepenthes gracilis]|uniref:Pentatricopeptide repeat-containing protein n=1 Tax=Nepenthes gracilis TaxID=150966 RepID=A0AAD3SDL6_NEPGR|nr:hypothetical protein Nepgr_011012 [Nepenthes gracilis]